MILSLVEHPAGVETAAGNRVVYDLGRDEAHFGHASVDGHACVWELGEHPAAEAVLCAEVELGGAGRWVLRCDRIDFPPGGVAYRHTHPGPGIRRMLFGSLVVETDGTSRAYGPGGAWFERGPDPVYAAAGAEEPSAFVRVMLLPSEWAGKRTISYLDPADEDRPKRQRPTLFFDRPLVL